MSQAFSRSFSAATSTAGSEREGHLRQLVEAFPDVDAWRPSMNELHLRDPALEQSVARAAARIARESAAAGLAAQLALFDARATHRLAPPSEAADRYLAAATELERADHGAAALRARIMAVDALAHAGRLAEAEQLAAEARAALGGPEDRLWREVLRVNHANALRLGGRLNEAIRAYGRAAHWLQLAGQEHTAAVALVNAGVVRMDLGRARQAHAQLGDAANRLEALGAADLAGTAREAEAWALAYLGDIGQALAVLQARAGEHLRGDRRRHAAVCHLDMARALLLVGDVDSARREAERAAREFERAGAAPEQADAALLVAGCRVRLGLDPLDALRVVRETSKATGNEGLRLRGALAQADYELRRASASDRTPHRKRLEELRQTAQRANAEVAERELTLALLVHLLREGDTNTAGVLASETQGRFERADPWTRAAWTSARAELHRQTGDTTTALRLIGQACALLDRVRAEIPGAWLRATFARNYLDPYLTRVEMLLGKGTSAARKQAAETLESLAAQRFLTEDAPAAQGVPAVLRRRLEAIYDRLARGDRQGERGTAIPVDRRLEQEAQRIERRIARRWQTQERTSTRAAPTAPRSSGRRLPDHVQRLHIWQHRGRIQRLLTDRSGAVEAEACMSSEELAQVLRLLSFQAHRWCCFEDHSAAEAHSRGLERLAARLLPTRFTNEPPKAVWVHLGSDLPDLPLEVLPLNGKPMAARIRLVRVPSLVGRRPRARVPGRVFLGVGGDDLPGVRHEIALAEGDDRVHLGEEATCEALREALLSAHTVHVAGHGYDAADAPPLAGVRLADGWFTSLDVPERIAARFVVLAACRTGLAAGPQGEAWGTLPSVLLRAGTRRVLHTTTDVDDRHTASLMRLVHAQGPRRSPESAFGRALSTLQDQHGHLVPWSDFRMRGLS